MLITLTLNWGDAWSIIGGAILIFMYFVPTYVAISREHHRVFGIAVLNLLTGWSALGWGATYIYAMESDRGPIPHS
ncbi:superinfection exclusion protein [Burkholderia phage BcepSaruman]|nr:superinfection exclusion protein [Burkholderia phage BcepSaruman]QBX06824.1 superinfection exclusion protein [Burkholderia phage BcepSaruman]